MTNHLQAVTLYCLASLTALSHDLLHIDAVI